MSNNSKIVQIFTDGACKGNPGPGGWGAVLKYGNSTKEIKGYLLETTNNVMELTAVIESLKLLNRPCNVTITTDSTYVKNGITKWIHQWKNSEWKTASKKPVKNKTYWKMLDSESKKHTIIWKWVKGHSGHPENERADKLANQAIINKE